MLKQLLTALLLSTLLSGCSTPPDEPQPLRLRVLTYNIHHGEGTDGKFDLERLAEIINRANPDLVALQEVDVETRRSGGVDQAVRLGELTGMQASFAEAMPFQGGRYGNALLTDDSLLPEVALAHVPLSLLAGPGQEPRVVVIGGVDPNGQMDQAIFFAGTHLSHESAETRLSQVEQINAMIEWDDKPAILAGDFNFTPGSDEYQAMINAGWVDAAATFGDPQPTIPSDAPKRRIDYVFVTPADRWRVIDVQVFDEPIASDHAPVLVELEYVFPR